MDIGYAAVFRRASTARSHVPIWFQLAGRRPTIFSSALSDSAKPPALAALIIEQPLTYPHANPCDPRAADPVVHPQVRHECVAFIGVRDESAQRGSRLIAADKLTGYLLNVFP